MNDLKQFPKCRAMVKALVNNQEYRRARTVLPNVVTLAKDHVQCHVIKEGPFAGVACRSKPQ